MAISSSPHNSQRKAVVNNSYVATLGKPLIQALLQVYEKLKHLTSTPTNGLSSPGSDLLRLLASVSASAAKATTVWNRFRTPIADLNFKFSTFMAGCDCGDPSRSLQATLALFLWHRMPQAIVVTDHPFPSIPPALVPFVQLTTAIPDQQQSKAGDSLQEAILPLKKRIYSRRWTGSKDEHGMGAKDAHGIQQEGEALGMDDDIAPETSQLPIRFLEQIDLLERCLPSSGWGEGLWCFNPHCMNMEGPSELQLKTFACGGGCGVRYCSEECQAWAWRNGHKLSCRRRHDN